MKTLLAALAFTLTLGGCGMIAQNPGSSYSPVNAVASDSAPHLILHGYDVVAYFTRQTAVPGKAEFSSRHENVDFHFASADNKALFDKNPQKYLPQFGGYCANGITYGIPWGGSGDTWLIIDDKLYLFGNQNSKDAFTLDTAGNLAYANKYWSEEIAGSNSHLQRLKRLIFRVPNYKSNEEIAKELAAHKAKG